MINCKLELERNWILAWLSIADLQWPRMTIKQHVIVCLYCIFILYIAWFKRFITEQLERHTILVNSLYCNTTWKLHILSYMLNKFSFSPYYSILFFFTIVVPLPSNLSMTIIASQSPDPSDYLLFLIFLVPWVYPASCKFINNLCVVQ